MFCDDGGSVPADYFFWNQLKNPKLSLEHLNIALRLDPEYVKAGMKRVQVYMELEMFEDAAREAENIFKKEKSQSKLF